MWSRVLFVYFFILNVSKIFSNNTFIPSKEWKVVEEDQAVPAGLHVRINLETGRKEAKLLDENGDQEEAQKSSLIRLESGKEEENKLDADELKEMLKKIKADDPSETTDKKQFRSYEEIKKDFEGMQIKIKSDSEILKEFMGEFHKLRNASLNSEPEKVLLLLKNFEDLVHKYDNAVVFSQLEGFSKVILPCINITEHDEIRSEALLVLGSATQSNPVVQQTAVNAGCIDGLVKLLALETNSVVRSRGIFALSALLRSYPAAQLKFVENGGISLLSTLYDNQRDDHLRLKIARLLTDLLIELIESANSPHRKELYESVQLDIHLREQGWCKRTADWVCGRIRWEDVSDLQEEDVDHQTIEVAVDFLQMLSGVCLDDFVTNIELLNFVNHIKQFYGDLSLREMDEGVGDTVYSDIYTKLRNFAVTLARTTQFIDEL